MPRDPESKNGVLRVWVAPKKSDTGRWRRIKDFFLSLWPSKRRPTEKESDFLRQAADAGESTPFKKHALAAAQMEADANAAHLKTKIDRAGTIPDNRAAAAALSAGQAQAAKLWAEANATDADADLKRANAFARTAEAVKILKDAGIQLSAEQTSEELRLILRGDRLRSSSVPAEPQINVVGFGCPDPATGKWIQLGQPVPSIAEIQQRAKDLVRELTHSTDELAEAFCASRPLEHGYSMARPAYEYSLVVLAMTTCHYPRNSFELAAAVQECENARRALKRAETRAFRPRPPRLYAELLLDERIGLEDLQPDEKLADWIARVMGSRAKK